MTKARKPAPKRKRRSKAKPRAAAKPSKAAKLNRGTGVFLQADDMVPRLGRPRFQPTDKDREWVRTCAGLGMGQERMAAILRIDRDTLVKHFRSDIDEGWAEIMVNVGSALYRKAMDKVVSGASVRAAEIILKRDRGWIEAKHPKEEGDDTSENEIVVKGGLLPVRPHDPPPRATVGEGGMPIVDSDTNPLPPVPPPETPAAEPDPADTAALPAPPDEAAP